VNGISYGYVESDMKSTIRVFGKMVRKRVYLQGLKSIIVSFNDPTSRSRIEYKELSQVSILLFKIVDVRD